jgi:hypothetical protein
VKKARALAGVAHVAVAEARHLQQHRVVVAVHEQPHHASRLPDVSPFIQSLLRVRLKKVAKPGRASRPGLLVHEADHQHLARFVVLDDRRE